MNVFGELLVRVVSKDLVNDCLVVSVFIKNDEEKTNSILFIKTKEDSKKMELFRSLQKDSTIIVNAKLCNPYKGKNGKYYTCLSAKEDDVHVILSEYVLPNNPNVTEVYTQSNKEESLKEVTEDTAVIIEENPIDEPEEDDEETINLLSKDFASVNWEDVSGF